MTMRALFRLLADRTGAAAAEMALVTPMLIVLMVGSFELGNYFLAEHVVQKAVRDAARYAARLPATDYPNCVPTADALSRIKKVARLGNPVGTASDQRLEGWSSDATVTVTVACQALGSYGGIYTGFPGGIPIVTVSASVPHASLFGTLGIPTPSLKLNAQSQTPVYYA